MISLLLLIFALVFLFLATVNHPGGPRMSWGWLGLLLWLLADVVGHLATFRV